MEKECSENAEMLATSICKLVNFTSELDEETLFHVVGPKILNHFSLFDLLLYKVKMLHSSNMENVWQLIQVEFEELRDSINKMITTCLEPVVTSLSEHEEKNAWVVELNEDMLSDFQLSDKIWQKKKEFEFEHPFFEPELLFQSSGEIQSQNDDEKCPPGDDSSLTNKTTGHLCLKCGQEVSKNYGKHHEDKCQGTKVRPPQYKKVNDDFFCSVEGCSVQSGFGSLYGVRKHFHSCHINEEEKYFPCDICDLRFSYRTSRNKHVQSVHVKKFNCDICSKAFGAKDKLASHQLVHSGLKPFACDKCSYKASKSFNLEKHKRAKHKEVVNKNFKCQKCTQMFISIGRLHRHEELIHLRAKK